VRRGALLEPLRTHPRAGLAFAVGLLAGCSSAKEMPTLDITDEAAARLSAGQPYEVRSRTGIDVRCVCVFDAEDNPPAEQTRARSVLRAWRSCQDPGPTLEANYSPISLSSGEGLALLIGPGPDGVRSELQTFRRREPALVNLTILYAPACFRAKGLRLNDPATRRGLEVIDERKAQDSEPR